MGNLMVKIIVKPLGCLVAHLLGNVLLHPLGVLEVGGGGLGFGLDFSVYRGTSLEENTPP